MSGPPFCFPSIINDVNNSVVLVRESVRVYHCFRRVDRNSMFLFSTVPNADEIKCVTYLVWKVSQMHLFECLRSYISSCENYSTRSGCAYTRSTNIHTQIYTLAHIQTCAIMTHLPYQVRNILISLLVSLPKRYDCSFQTLFFGSEL